MKIENQLEIIKLAASINDFDIEESSIENISIIDALCIVVNKLWDEISLLSENKGTDLQSKIQVDLPNNKVTINSPLPPAVERAERLHNEQFFNLSKLIDDTLDGKINLDEAVANFEKEIISRALQMKKNNKTATSELLGITFRALRYKLKVHNME